MEMGRIFLEDRAGGGDGKAVGRPEIFAVSTQDGEKSRAEYFDVPIFRVSPEISPNKKRKPVSPKLASVKPESIRRSGEVPEAISIFLRDIGPLGTEAFIRRDPLLAEKWRPLGIDRIARISGQRADFPREDPVGAFETIPDS